MVVNTLKASQIVTQIGDANDRLRKILEALTSGIVADETDVVLDLATISSLEKQYGTVKAILQGLATSLP